MSEPVVIIHGVDSNGTIMPLLVSATGQVLVGSIPAGSSLIGRVNGQNGNKIFAYENAVSISYSSGALPAGLSRISAYGVAANKVLVVKAIRIRYDGTVALVALTPYIYNNVTYTYFGGFVKPPVSAYSYIFNVDVILSAGWTVGCAVENATINDQAYVDFNWYIMDVTP